MSNLKATLDRWFSLYIRLRDSDANGFGRCISCGKLVHYKEADCGHFINRQHMNTRYDERNCNLQCRSCLTLDALILMDDLRWKPLADVKVGDTVLGFEEFIHRKSSRRFALTKVIHAEVVVKDVYEVELANGDKIKTTADHKWLARRGGSTAYQWLETQDLWVDSYNLKGNHISGPFREHVFSTVCKPFRVIEQICNEECGWLARLDLDKIGKIRSKYDTTVKSITHVGKMEVMDLETDCHTYIANGYAMHNCNRFDEGNNVGYMQGLVKKYGEGVIQELTVKKHLYRKYSDFEYKELIKYYKKKVKEWQK